MIFPLQVFLIIQFKHIVHNSFVFLHNSLKLSSAYFFEQLSMLFNYIEDGGAFEVREEVINLLHIRKVVTTGVELVDVSPILSYCLQVLVQTLLCCYLSPEREMIVKLIGLKSIEFSLVINIIPLDIKEL